MIDSHVALVANGVEYSLDLPSSEVPVDEWRDVTLYENDTSLSDDLLNVLIHDAGNQGRFEEWLTNIENKRLSRDDWFEINEYVDIAVIAEKPDGLVIFDSLANWSDVTYPVLKGNGLLDHLKTEQQHAVQAPRGLFEFATDELSLDYMWLASDKVVEFDI